MSFEVLLHLGTTLEGLCFTSFEVCLFRLAFSLAFFRAFRISELVTPSRRCEGGLCYEDVGVFDGRLECVLRRSKTDQQGRGTIIVLHELWGSPMYPVGSYAVYVSGLGVGRGPLLQHAEGTFLSQFQFIQVFRGGLTSMGDGRGAV